MATFYADQYKPEFGMPYPRWDETYETKPPEELEMIAKGKMIAEAHAKHDPLQYGWTLETWRECMEEWAKYQIFCICGGNRSTKSSFVAKLVVDAAMKIPEAKIRCYHVNEEKSKSEQQAMVWAALPQRLKVSEKKKGTNYSIQYNQKNGFTGDKLILPPQPGFERGSEIMFCNYQQYKNDSQVAEGWWAHIIWCDEEAPQKLFDTLKYRLIDARGRMLLTFTTLNGWTPLVADIMAHTKTVRTRFSPILNRAVPIVQDSLVRPCRIYYWWTIDNPFIPGEDFVASLKGRPAEEILARAHGIPTRQGASPFPGFDESVHVMPRDKLPWVEVRRTVQGKLIPPVEVTFYHVIDPSGSKPWFMLWAAVDPADKVYVFREFPDQTFGPWAEHGNDSQGRPGSAQRALRWGIQDYVDHIKQLEDGDDIYERFIDPRLGATPTQGRDGATDIITELDDADMTTIAAPGLHIDHGLQLINDRLSYNAEQPISAANSPRLFISDDCHNLIFAMKNYTALGGKDEATKDPIDCLRYLLSAGADFVSKNDVTGGSQTFSY